MGIHPDDIKHRDGQYEVTVAFESMYSGRCTIDSGHRIKRGEWVGKVRRIDNPLLPIPGVACVACLKILPRTDE